MEKDVTPIEATPAPPPAEQENTELETLWREYLQKCCEVGQIRYQLDQLDGQKRSMEKQLEVTERAVVSVAAKHRDLLAKEKAKAAPSEPKAH